MEKVPASVIHKWMSAATQTHNSTNKNVVRRLLAYATKDTISLEQTNKMKASY